MFTLSVGLFQKLTKIVRLRERNFSEFTFTSLQNLNAICKLHGFAILCQFHEFEVLLENNKFNCFLLQVFEKVYLEKADFKFDLY